MTSNNRTGQRVGRYELGEPLGRGGMAEVYRATDASLGRAVAVKLILPHFAAQADFRERFLREARLVAALNHPNILPVYDFGEEDGVAFLVMPLLEGGSLADRMEGRSFPLEQVVEWVGQLAGALDAAHGEGILHRDVKPSNVLVGKDGRLSLADFGIAKSAESSTRLTTTGAVVGTPAYMAPELARGETASPASDRYALAVLAYELLAGDPPFRGDSALAVLHRHVTEPVPPITRKVPALPKALDRVLERALAKEPGERPESCIAFAVELAQAAGITAPWTAATALKPPPADRSGLEPTVVTPSAGTQARGTRVPAVRGGAAAARGGRSPIWVTLALLGAIAVIVGLGWSWLRPQPTPGASENRAMDRELDPAATPIAPPSSASLAAAGALPTAAAAPAGKPTERAPLVPRGSATDIAPPPDPRASTVAATPSAPPATPPAAPSVDTAAEPRPGAPGAALVAAPVAPLVRGLTTIKHVGERASGLLRPTRRLSERDFRELLASVAELAPSAARSESERALGAGLEAFSRGGLAWLSGDLAKARQELDRAAEEAARSLSPMANPGLVLRTGALDSSASWQLAFAFGDARGDAARLLAEARSAGSLTPAQAEFGTAVVERWDGHHAEAAQRALRMLESSATSLAEVERSQVAQLAAEELAMSGDVEGAARAFDRAIADAGTQRGPLALEAAMVVGTRAGRPDLAGRFLATACAAGMERACIDPPAAGERRILPFGRRRPRPGSPGG